MAQSRRMMVQPPRLTRRAWEDVARDLEEFLSKLMWAWSDGIPPGFNSGVPTAIEAGDTGEVGTEAAGWAPADHEHPVFVDVPVGLGYEPAEGESTQLVRADHVHPYLDLTEDLIVSYRLEETSGNRYPSYGNDLLIESSAVAGASGKIGEAAQFSGANYLYINDATSLQQGDFDYSICVWGYLDSLATDQYIVAKDGGAGNREYGIYYDSVSGTFKAFLQSTVPTVFTVEALDTTPVVDTWYFIHMGYDDTNSLLSIQVNDGVEYTESCGAETPYVSGTYRFMVGAHDDATPALFWNGRVDALHWWQRLLSSGEHDIMYAGGDGREIWIPTTATSVILTPGGTAKNSTGLSVSDIVVWEAPYNATVTAVRAVRKGGTGATINMRRNYTDEHLSGDLSLVAAGTTYDGGAVQNTAYAAGDIMEARIKSVAGSPTEIAIWARVERT